jgi:L-threonylcarbamoyladenylate synthase
VNIRWYQLHQAVRVLRDGGVIAYPTEGVWGLGCDPANAGAVARVLELKARPVSKGLILVLGSVEQALPYLAGLGKDERDCVLATWPGAVTWVVPAPGWVPYWIRGDSTGVAVRVSAHAQTAALCRAFGGALVSTSANRAGHPPAPDALRIRRQLGRGIDFLLPGRLGGRSGPSEIRDARSGSVLRAG